jgi:mRNA interferase MazF
MGWRSKPWSGRHFTIKQKGIPLHVEVQPPEGGLKQQSFIKCEDMSSVAKGRLVEQWGKVTQRTLAEVEDRLRLLLGL